MDKETQQTRLDPIQGQSTGVQVVEILLVYLFLITTLTLVVLVP